VPLILKIYEAKFDAISKRCDAVAPIMSFPRYPQYKDSGVEWLGEVPGHWEVVQFKLFVDIQNGTDHKHVEQAEGYPVIGSGGAFTYASDYLYDGESVLLGRKGTIDKPLHVNGRFWTVDTMYWTKINPETSGRYSYYTALTIPFNYYSTSTALPSMTKSALGSHLVTRPSLAEQTQIAAFLDRETAKIDELVAQQRRLMELLKEKRQAVISHAVTQGLNPQAPMKPSGIEWLGDVPAHWEVMQLKRDVEFLTSGSRGWAENYADEGELFIRITNLTRGTITLDLSDIKRVAVPDGAEGSRTKVQPDDILFSITAYLGSIAIVPENLESAYVSQHIALVRLEKSYLTSKWVGYVALSFVGQTWFNTKSYGGTKIQLSLDDVKELPIPTPPIYEQLAIVSQLELESAKFDTLTNEAQHAIDLLQERRTALISAAVTGQIDVRQAA
jgi:type I restriction enzyme, S subunit